MENDKKVYLMRHADHYNNNLTEKGIEQTLETGNDFLGHAKVLEIKNYVFPKTTMLKEEYRNKW